MGIFGDLFITDARVPWRPIIDMAARMVVPFGETTDVSVAWARPPSGRPHLPEALRYGEAGEEAKILPIDEGLEWEDLDGTPTSTIGA